MKPVLVTTEFRGVFFGYAEATDGDVIQLKGARNAIYWPRTQGGFLGLAEKGPVDDARIGATADIELRKITSVSDVTPAAEKAWKDAPTYVGR